MEADPFMPPAAEAFLSFGIHRLAYIKPIELDGARAVGIFSADGKAIANAPSVEIARAMIRLEALEPVLVH